MWWAAKRLLDGNILPKLLLPLHFFFVLFINIISILFFVAGFRDCEPGSYCITGIKKLCPAGTYGNISALTTRKCSGPCPAGYFCPEATTSPIICGSAGVYCPQGSGAPIEVKIGYYAVGSIDNEGLS